MRITHALIAIALSSISVPVLAQDFLAPIQDFVDQLTPKEQPRQAPRNTAGPTAPKPPSVDAPPVPRPRPPSLPEAPVVAAPSVPAVEDEEEPPAAEAEEVPEAVEPEPTPVAEKAEPEPARIYQVACPAVMLGLVEAELAPPLSEGICGEHSPLVVTGVTSRGRMVPLSSPITTNCQMASALPNWVSTVDGYAESMLESRLATINAGTGYMCRNRNGGDESFTSEHGFANAVDVTGFTLEDGRTIAVEGDWLPAAEPEGRLLRLAHDAACGGFTTVLGPEANAEHKDHLHLDLGCHGKTCTARICE
ncbi:extensin family protein [Devosia sp. 2618]|uniref:extensin-like domain-containing protein n=1 Tax=Devosia sp. 2618 TaxID=3156454 RepID=UPI0033964613